MERIKLSRLEKAALRHLGSGGGASCPDGLTEPQWAAALGDLEERGLAQVVWATGHAPAAARLTNKGERYLRRNPRLRNPVEWKWIALAVIVLLGLFACARGHAAALTAAACLAYCLAR